MSLPSLITQIINLFCGTYLTWQTSKAFHIPDDEEMLFDNLLIRWIILYVVIYLEEIFIFFFEWIPLLGTFIALLPFLIKIYILLPHSQGYLKIYGLLEQLELDESNGRLLNYIQRITKFCIVKSLRIIENYVDIIQSDDLDEVEEYLNRINQQVIDKRTQILVRQSIIKFKRNDKSPLQAARSSEIYRSSYVQSKNKVIQDDDANMLNILASVMTEKAHDHKPAIFQDYKLSFNREDCSLSFYDLESNELLFRETLREINHGNKTQKILNLVYEEYDVEDEGYFQVIKLRDLNDTNDWLRPVIEILLSKLNQVQ